MTVRLSSSRIPGQSNRAFGYLCIQAAFEHQEMSQEDFKGLEKFAVDMKKLSTGMFRVGVALWVVVIFLMYLTEGELDCAEEQNFAAGAGIGLTCIVIGWWIWENLPRQSR